MKRGRAAAWALSACAFAAVFALHGWWMMYGKAASAQSRWAALPAAFGDRFSGYVDSGMIWLGYCYAASAGFAVWMLLTWWKHRATNRAAVGGLTFAGALGASACFMVGCCGSPLLGVWVALLGAAAAPWLGPAAAVLTTLSLVATGWWMARKSRCGASCNCDAV